jgi:hypothetical protein
VLIQFNSYAEQYTCKHLFIRGVPQENLSLEELLKEEDSDYGRMCRAIMQQSDMP